MVTFKFTNKTLNRINFGYKNRILIFKTIFSKTYCGEKQWVFLTS
jgi:hypothetical protein